MSKFDGFSEAAVVYAKNATVVRAMEEAMHRSIACFVEDLIEYLKRTLAPIGVETKLYRQERPHVYCLFWTVGNDRVPWIAFDQNEPSIVHPGTMEFYVWGPQKPTPLDKARVAEICRSDALRSLNLPPTA